MIHYRLLFHFASVVYYQAYVIFNAKRHRTQFMTFYWCNAVLLADSVRRKYVSL